MDEATKRLYGTTDAAVWAEEFMKVVDSGASIDFGLMVGWFANAMTTKSLGCRIPVEDEGTVRAWNSDAGWASRSDAARRISSDVAVRFQQLLPGSIEPSGSDATRLKAEWSIALDTMALGSQERIHEEAVTTLAHRLILAYAQFGAGLEPVSFQTKEWISVPFPGVDDTWNVVIALVTSSAPIAEAVAP